MKILASSDAVELIQERGSRLYVWTDLHRCCSGSTTYLLTSSRDPANRRFTMHHASGFELWLDTGGAKPPDELHLEMRGWRKKRVDAYWNGCAFKID